MLKTPPMTKPRPLATYLWKPFNKPDYAVSLARNDEHFHSDEDGIIPRTSVTEPQQEDNTQLHVKYFLHPRGTDQSVMAGAAVLAWESICPEFDSSPNDNLFGSYFGVEFTHENWSYVRPFSPFEFCSAHQLCDDLVYKLSHPDNKFAMNSAIPGITSA